MLLDAPEGRLAAARGLLRWLGCCGDRRGQRGRAAVGCDLRLGLRLHARLRALDVEGHAVAGLAREERAQQIGFGRYFLHFRMTFSDGVSASMNAGREKIRSAYFISGAAVLPSLMP